MGKQNIQAKEVYSTLHSGRFLLFILQLHEISHLCYQLLQPKSLFSSLCRPSPYHSHHSLPTLPTANLLFQVQSVLQVESNKVNEGPKSFFQFPFTCAWTALNLAKLIM